MLAVFEFDPGYVTTLLSRRLRDSPLPAFALAAYFFRRPSDLAQLPEIDSHEDLISAFKSYFHISATDVPLFDFSVPAWASPLSDDELSRAEVVRIVATAPHAGEIASLLAAEASGEVGDRCDEIVACALKMGQVLLFGPPGTGKSYWAEKAALRLTGHADLSVAAYTGEVAIVAWHPSTTYEDFVGGMTVRKGSIKRRSGIFQNFCERAAANSTRRHVLVVDEINRGNTVAIFGELLFALELDKRGKPVQLTDGKTIVVPSNVYILGTANTADRSIAALDVALGRRFARVEIAPEPELLGSTRVAGVLLQDLLRTLNTKVTEAVDREHRIGHSYLLGGDDRPISSFDDLAFTMKYRIVPLLQDYAIDDFDILEEILGVGFVDAGEQRIKAEAFRTEAALEAALRVLIGS
ncbi:MAG TPA: AAA family ATPase [Candidatus Binatia bacterium]|nr:AAA family ATPase [Candidatus Binatia bacterium]